MRFDAYLTASGSSMVSIEPHLHSPWDIDLRCECDGGRNYIISFLRVSTRIVWDLLASAFVLLEGSFALPAIVAIVAGLKTVTGRRKPATIPVVEGRGVEELDFDEEIPILQMRSIINRRLLLQRLPALFLRGIEFGVLRACPWDRTYRRLSLLRRFSCSLV